MVQFYYFHDFEFDWEKNYWDLNILGKMQFIKQTRSFDVVNKDNSCWYWYLLWWKEQFLKQIVQISIIFISNKLKLMEIKEWYHVTLTSISQPKLGQIVHVGVFLITSWQADFKYVPGFEQKRKQKYNRLLGTTVRLKNCEIIDIPVIFPSQSRYWGVSPQTSQLKSDFSKVRFLENPMTDSLNTFNARLVWRLKPFTNVRILVSNWA